MKSNFKSLLLLLKIKYSCPFYSYQENEGPEAGVKRKVKLYSCWAYVPQWKMTELQQAISNGTEHDVKIFIRETHGQYVPNEKHYVEIESPYIHQDLNIKLVQPDVENEQF